MIKNKVKQKWDKPKLIVVSTGDGAESVLVICKATAAIPVTQTTFNFNCTWNDPTWPCILCDAVPAGMGGS